ncbi:response regulator [Paenibacillus cymbidii]|uniref:response regulator n=1 Tax=Paenibacillus cymbidii TaxID=1639034 RepID=UPI001081079F|nr:response regulator [Paenibacillus cymbidii]
MRNVMIVDDESLVRVGLQSIIDWESYGYSIAGVFKNGEEALQAAKHRTFDVALTDIKMPVMDGFELIEQLKRLQPHINIVVLSSYDEFTYTRRAIQLGVADYISKYQLEPEELIRVLNALHFVSAETDAAGGSAAAASAERSVLLHAEKEELLRYSGLPAGGIEREPEWPELTRLLRGTGELVCWVALKPYPREPGYLPSEQKALQAMAGEIFARLRGMELLGWDRDMLHGLAVFPQEEPRQTRERALADAASELIGAARNINVALVIGVSRPEPLPQPIVQRQRAMLAMEPAFCGGPGYYADRETNGPLSSFSEKEQLAFYTQAKQLIRLQRFEELHGWFAGLAEERGATIRQAEWQRLGHTVATQLTDLVIERFHLHADKIERHFAAMWPLAEYVERAGSMGELTARVRETALKVQQMMALMQAGQGWIQRVKDYVEQRYDEPIRLEDAAELVSFNENYFSQRFRQETGEGFSDYVTRYRIGKAMQLYQETELSTEEVALRVGYANANYFVKVFKKVTGTTVSAFRHRN